MNLRAGYTEFSIIQVHDTSVSEELLDLVRRSSIYFAHVANISLYTRDGHYTIPELNETRGDYADAILNDTVFAILHRNKFIAHVRLISDYQSRKTLLTRFAIDPDYINMNIEATLLSEVASFLKMYDMEELYVYIPIENEYLMNIYRENLYLPYSINDGIPYPIACLVRRLYRER